MEDSNTSLTLRRGACMLQRDQDDCLRPRKFCLESTNWIMQGSLHCWMGLWDYTITRFRALRENLSTQHSPLESLGIAVIFCVYIFTTQGSLAMRKTPVKAAFSCEVQLLTQHSPTKHIWQNPRLKTARHTSSRSFIIAAPSCRGYPCYCDALLPGR